MVVFHIQATLYPSNPVPASNKQVLTKHYISFNSSSLRHHGSCHHRKGIHHTEVSILPPAPAVRGASVRLLHDPHVQRYVSTSELLTTQAAEHPRGGGRDITGTGIEYTTSSYTFISSVKDYHSTTYVTADPYNGYRMTTVVDYTYSYVPTTITGRRVSTDYGKRAEETGAAELPGPAPTDVSKPSRRGAQPSPIDAPTPATITPLAGPTATARLVAGGNGETYDERHQLYKRRRGGSGGGGGSSSGGGVGGISPLEGPMWVSIAGSVWTLLIVLWLVIL
jgi:hypothetical protein